MTNIPWLTYLDSEGRNQQWLLEKETTVIGRRPPADLIFPAARISRRHAFIQRREFDFAIADMGSRNGTFVNGQEIGRQLHPLTGGDEIVLGGVIALRFEDPDETTRGPRLGRLKGIWIDSNVHTAWVDSILVDPPLSAAQFTLLALLYEADGAVISRAGVISAVWPNADPSGVSEEAVDGLIKRLRQRLRKTQPAQDYIRVIRGRGLQLLQPK